MSSTFGILEAAKSGLSVSMQNLNITGHNISNANTVGYTRQRLITSAKDTKSSVYLISQTNDNKIGKGVEVTSVQQIRSEYLDDQYRDLNSDYEYSEYRTQPLTYLEGLFDPELDEGEGLTGAIEDFYTALNDFTSDTTSEEYRTAVQQTALSLTETFNLVYEEMTDLWSDQNDSISTDAQEINSLAEQMAQLNKAIAQYERSGETANDLRDERNLLLDELSGYVNISYSNNEDNPSMTDVQIGGIDLVCGTTANVIEIDAVCEHTAEIDMLTTQIANINEQISSGSITATDGQTQINDLVTQLSGYIDITTSENTEDGSMTDVSFCGVSLVTGSSFASISDAAESDLTAWIELNRNNLTLDGSELSIEAGTVTSGELYAHIEMATSENSESAGIPYYMDQLNSLTQEIAQAINTVHTSGYTYPTDIAESTKGINFFDVPKDAEDNEDYSLITAGNFALSDEILESVWNIAGSNEAVTLDGTTMETGNDEIASELYNTITDGEIYSSLNTIVDHLAIALNTSVSLLDTKESLLNSVDTQRTSVSGVSVDEETTNLIVYQQSYNACSRVITAIDEMLETLISSTGNVGR